MICGITTAPRPGGVSYLEKTLRSLFEAGLFGSRVTVFAEPGSFLVEQPTAAHLWQNLLRRGNFGNWKNMAGVLCRDADDQREKYILTAEDDIFLSPEAIPRAAAILEKLTAENENIGCLCLYSSRKYQLLAAGRSIFSLSKQELWRARSVGLEGACALAWPVNSLKAVLESKTVQEWRGGALLPFPEGSPEIAHVDTCIGHALNELGLNPYFMNPCLADHVGEVSAVMPGKTLTEFRRADSVL